MAGNVDSLNTLLVCKYNLKCTVAMIVCCLILGQLFTGCCNVCVTVGLCVFSSVYKVCGSVTLHCLMFYVDSSHYFVLYLQHTGLWLQMVLPHCHGDRHRRCGWCCSSLSLYPSHLAHRNSPTWVLEIFEIFKKYIVVKPLKSFPAWNGGYDGLVTQILWQLLIFVLH